MIRRSLPHSIIRIPAGIAFLLAFLASCSDMSDRSKYIVNLLSRKVNLDLNDSIIELTTKDAGIDLHGSWSETYIATISKNDLNNVIHKIEEDTTHGWIETNIGDYITTLYPIDYRDTIFSVGIMRSNSTIHINIRQGW